MYMNISKGWHLPCYWGPSESGGQGGTATYNKFWGCLSEFRRAMSLPVLDPTLAGSYNGKNVNNASVIGFVPAGKWYCPDSGRLDVLQDSYWYSSPGVIGGTVVPMHYSYGMNVHGADLNAGSNFAWDASKAPQADPARNPAIFTIANSGRATGAVHGFRFNQVKRPAEKLMFADAMWFALNIYGSGMTTGWGGTQPHGSDYDVTLEHTNSHPPNRSIDYGDGTYNTERTIAWRHHGGANVCFFDGHVAWLRKDEIYTPDAGGNKLPNYKLWNVMDSAAPVGPP
jgi:prepilin-type processing-associated H-X9-DG protein